MEGIQLAKIDKYKYLGATINSQLDQDEEITVRLEIARKEFIKYRSMHKKEIKFRGDEIKVSRMLCIVSAVIWGKNLDAKSTIHKKIGGIGNVALETHTYLGLLEPQMYKVLKRIGEVINNLRYADDTVLLAAEDGSADDLPALLDRVAAKSEARRLKVNISKTKAMVISKNGELLASLSTGNQQIQLVSSFKYLRCLLSSEMDNKQEISSRIDQARAAFSNMKNVFTSRD